MKKIIKQVFYDSKKLRWRYSKRMLVATAVFLIAVFGTMMASFFINPNLPSLDLQPPKSQYRGVANVSNGQNNPIATVPTKFSSGVSTTNSVNSNINTKILAFYVNWDDNSFTSLKKNLNTIDELMPEWLHLGDNGSIIVDDQSKQDMAMAYIKQNKPNLPIAPLINNYNSDTDQWDVDRLSTMLSSPDLRAKLIGDSLSFVQNNGLTGISIDFESVPDAQQKNLVVFMQELYARFHPLGFEVSQNIPLDDATFDAKTLSQYNDFLILMAYDEHSTSDTKAGPVASQGWYETVLKKRLQELPANKYIIALGGYGYDWEDNSINGSEVSFQDAVRIARESDGKIKIDPASLNPTFDYYDDNNKLHHVWYLDAVSAYDEIMAGNHFGPPHGYVLWRLGSEDPGIWNVFSGRQKLDSQVADSLKKMEYGYDINYEGDGEILRITGTPQTGARDIALDLRTGLINSENVTTFPMAYTITRWGKNDSKKIALTFDDGPDAKYTPKILDVLKQYNVPATFFVVGANANVNSSLLTREFSEGHQIGNHTFSHPNVENISDQQFILELDSTERLIEGLLGRKSTLFRPPYAEDIEPETPDQVRPLTFVSDRGYYTVGMHIDPKDWSRPGINNIVDNAVNSATAGDGNVILMHDGGGNRDQTLAALPIIIEKLRSQGFEFVTISSLLNLQPNDIMPQISAREQFVARINSVAFNLLALVSNGVRVMFLIGIIFGLMRFMFIGILAIIQRIHSHRIWYGKNLQTFQPFVSVVIPAYNESKVISRTINAILKSVYPSFDIIVVDDGSVDDTLVVLDQKFLHNPKVKIFTEKNSGKSQALNFGISQTQAEIIITLDADTIFRADTISMLIRRFSDDRISAVAGNAKVGNRINLLTRWQALEYITSQNLDRRAFELMNCIAVVPGAIGAWRRDAIIEAGGFSVDTLAEDADLTFSILRNGHMIAYDDEALAYTETPDTVKNFIKQRFRWMYGTLQAAWKHRDALFRKKYGALGFFAIPNVFIFQVFFPLISPLMDLMMLASIAWVTWQKYNHPVDFSAMQNFRQIFVYYLFFLAIDFITAMVPFFLERHEDWTLLIWLPLQRFSYRQLMYYVAIKAAMTAIKGRLVGWSKFERKDTVKELT